MTRRQLFALVAAAFVPKAADRGVPLEFIYWSDSLGHSGIAYVERAAVEELLALHDEVWSWETE
jgi:hypothetical protein